jgi:hypothetical protein
MIGTIERRMARPAFYHPGLQEACSMLWRSLIPEVLSAGLAGVSNNSSAQVS